MPVSKRIKKYRNKTKRSKDGYMLFCKKCHYIQVKANRNNYKEYDKKYSQLYYHENKEKIANMAHKSKSHFKKVADFAWKHTTYKSKD
jgi:hypothetical protein